MSNECKVKIKVGNASIQDLEDVYGFYLLESDNTIVAPVKDYETQVFPESNSVEIYPFTSLKEFDYNCSFLCIGSLETINTTLIDFYDSLFTTTVGTDLREAKLITLYNNYKGVQVSGYAKSMNGKTFYPKLVEYEKGAYIFDLTIFVADPSTLMDVSI